METCVIENALPLRELVSFCDFRDTCDLNRRGSGLSDGAHLPRELPSRGPPRVGLPRSLIWLANPLALTARLLTAFCRGGVGCGTLAHCDIYVRHLVKISNSIKTETSWINQHCWCEQKSRGTRIDWERKIINRWYHVDQKRSEIGGCKGKKKRFFWGLDESWFCSFISS